MTEIQKAVKDSISLEGNSDIALWTGFNKAWTKFNLQNSHVVKWRFCLLINELVELGELPEEVRQPNCIVQSTCGK